ncbi:MAG: hypothetical protein EPO40_06430 [Myxococcaceae bacterium]|nr:MAG: hypothetical protein EPO40_06430 [Myxococcaceae bacterium]
MLRGRWTGWALLGALALGGCDLIEPPPPPRCVAVEGEATVPVAQVCARLDALNCRLPDCAQAYASYQSRVSPAEFSRLTSCYLHATSCSAVGECELACGSDGGMIVVAPPRDAATDASADASAEDAGAEAGTDAGSDTGADVGTDVGTDVGSDTGTDVGMDVGSDTGADVMESEVGADAAD